jgi:hypothetical protein
MECAAPRPASWIDHGVPTAEHLIKQKDAIEDVFAAAGRLFASLLLGLD